MAMMSTGMRKAKKEKKPSLTLRTMTTTMTHLPPAAAAVPLAAATADALGPKALTVIANVNPNKEAEKLTFQLSLAWRNGDDGRWTPSPWSLQPQGVAMTWP